MHPIQTYYIRIEYMKPLSRDKVKASESILKLKEHKIYPRIYLMNPYSEFVLTELGLTDNIFVGWPTVGANYVQELIKLDDLYTRFKELLAGSDYKPYEVPDEYKLYIGGEKLRKV